MCAKGLSVEEITNVALSIDKNWIRETAFWDLDIPPHGGFLGGLKLQRFFKTLFDDLEFKDLELPFVSIATDIHTGEEIVIKEGRVIDAVRASIAIPVIFKPHKLMGRLLVDGGLVNPVPTSALIGQGADILIATRLTDSPSERRFSIGLVGKTTEEIKEMGVLDIFFRTISTMSHQIAISQTEIAHVVIHPKAPNYNWVDFEKAGELIRLGEEAAWQVMPKIKALLPFFADNCATRVKL
ncbi:MAG: patatin-like phospholipase family protein [Elusimicrobia bacterium]|nr:patatin-like phospholipase family protein [Elusimicrobiota bacterium]